MLQQQGKQMISASQVHTGSVLQMKLPQQFSNSNCFFQWFCQYNNPTHYDNILTRFDVSKMNKTNQYQCTPLDYGNIIIGRVLLNQQSQNKIVQQVKYGPVMLQNGIDFNTPKPADYQVKIILTKNVILNGHIKIISAPIVNNNNSKIKILIQSQQFKFSINVDQNIRLPSNNSFFKFYDKEEENLGISIYHQHSQFIQKLKQMKNTMNFGFYIKISFPSKHDRDKFLFQLLQIIGIRFSTLKSPTLEVPKINKNINSFMKRSRSSILHSNQKQVENDRKKQIDDQIFKLLYEASEVHNQSSLNMDDAQLLFSQKQQDENCEKSLIIKNISYQNKQQINKKDYKQQQKVRQSINQAKIKTGISNILNQKSGQQFVTIRNIYQNIPQKQQGNQNYLRTTISKLTHQIKTLIKQNRKLAQQNKRLKDENMRLRFKQVKNCSVKMLNDPIIRCKSKQPNIQQKQKSNSISPQKIDNQKRLFTKSYKQEKVNDKTIELKAIQRKTMQQRIEKRIQNKQYEQNEKLNENKSNERPKIMKKKSLTANQGVGCLIGVSHINSNRNFQYVRPPVNTVLHRDSIKQRQIYQNLMGNQLIEQRRSQGFHRAKTPQIHHNFSQTPPQTIVIPKYTIPTGSIKSLIYRK